MSQLQGLHLHVQAHVLTAPGSRWNAAGPAPLPSVRPSPRVHRPSPRFLPVVCMCYPRLPPAQSCHHCPQLCSSLGIVGLVTLGHRGGGPGPQTLRGSCPAVHRIGGHRSAPPCAPGVSEAPLTWSNPSSCWRCPAQSHSAEGAWLQGCAGMGAREGTQAVPGALRGCSTAFVALSGRGSATRRQGSATHQVSMWFTAPSSPVAKPLPEGRQSCL